MPLAMPLADYAKRLLHLAETIYQWLGTFAGLEAQAREKVALFSEEIAASLARAAMALTELEAKPGDKASILTAVREFGRISGYLATIVGALDHHLDGRKLSGVKRRLETLEPFDLEAVLADQGAFAHAARLTSAEGFFRALADALRA
jgi:hypothetical protein